MKRRKDPPDRVAHPHRGAPFDLNSGRTRCRCGIGCGAAFRLRSGLSLAVPGFGHPFEVAGGVTIGRGIEPANAPESSIIAGTIKRTYIRQCRLFKYR